MTGVSGVTGGDGTTEDRAPVEDGTPVDWVAELGLEPHPEGGHFRRLYTSRHERDAGDGRGRRPLATSIWYLLTPASPQGEVHRTASDVLHFLVRGGPVTYAWTDGEATRVVELGPRTPFVLVPGGWWKASGLRPGAGPALVAEVVVPGFEWDDHDFAGPEDLAALPAAMHDARARFAS